MSTSTILRPGRVGIDVTPDVSAGGGDVAFICIRGGDTCVAFGLVGWGEGGCE